MNRTRCVKSIVFILIISTLFFLLSGCWDYKEINEIAIVAGMAVDKDKDSGDFIVTVEIVNAQQGGSKDQGGFSAEIYNGQGKTIFEAIRNMILKVGRRLYWSHAKVGIISEDIAREGIVGVLDWIERDPEVRTNMRLFISKEKSAGEIFYSYCPIESTISFQLEKMIENSDGVEKVPDIDTWRFTNDLSSEGISAVTPVVYLIHGKDAVIPQVYGTAVFKEDRLVGYLDGNESQSFLFVRNEVKGGIIHIENAAGSKNDVSLEIQGAKSKIKPVYKDGKLKMNINVEMDVSIGEIEGTINVIQDKGQMELKEQSEKQVKRNIEEVIKKAQQEYHSDIFGFGKTINRKLPGYWKKVRNNWEEEFSNLDTEVNVKINIIGSATTSEPLKIGD